MTRTKIIYAIVAVSVAVLGLYYFFGTSKGSTYEYFIVHRGDVVQEVSVTGKVEPLSSASLSFDRTGKIVSFEADIGDKVYAGQPLAYLDSSELRASLLSAEAGVSAARAKLEQLKNGARPEELSVSETKVLNSATALSDAKGNVVNYVNDAFMKSDDAVRNKIDQFFNNPKSANPTLTFTVTDSVLSSEIEFQRFVMEGVLQEWASSVSGLSSSGDLDKYITEASSNLAKVQTFLDKVAFAVNGLIATASISQTTIDSYKAAVSTARVNINTSITYVASANEKLRTARSTKELAEKELALLKSGSASEEIEAQEAVLEQALANAENYRVQVGKTVLRTPISGVVAKKYYSLGEIAAVNAPVFDVMSVGDFEMKANIPEADIAKVKIGDKARVTLDAYGDDVLFEANVSKIDPAETMIEGVATYRTILVFSKKDDRIRSGMTANIDIMTAKKEGVLVVPQRSVVTKDSGKYVFADKGGDKPEEVKFEAGLRGSDGYLEVLSGLEDGQKILSMVEE